MSKTNAIVVVCLFAIFLPCILAALKPKASSTTPTSSLTDTAEKVIYINEKSAQTIRLKSVRSILEAMSGFQAAPPLKTTQKIFWSFKRIYSLPIFINEIQSGNNNNHTNTNVYIKSKGELSQTELMISLDAEVQDNLKEKYSIDEVSKYDLIIQNLTYADMGLYKCNLWNQRTIYYYLSVTSPALKPEIEFSNKIVVESANVSMKCSSKYSYPYPNIKWFRNEKEM